MEAVAARIPAPAAVPQPHVTIAGLRHALGDCLLAVSFLVATLPAGREIKFSLAGAANLVWLTGAAVMAVMSFARFAPRSTTVNLQTLVASGGMMILPCFMRPTNQSSGALATAGIILELIGVTLTQVSRVYMGRSFGILPANRGVVSKGPFQWVRHPIYLGWLVLSIGYATSYVNDRNVILIVVTFALMVWRISQEEALLSADPAYRAYMDHVHYRLLPGLT
jgi:isoprenylcysteine carboxyl methyltransferase (ICMT) family protein YpbQ